MPRPRRAARTRRETITEGETLWAYGRLDANQPEHFQHYATQFFTPKARFREVWEELRDEVVAEWIEENPGTRPQHWWTYDAPGQRRRLGGTGTPAHEVLADKPQLDRGIPMIWVRPKQVAYYNGRAVDIHGNAIGKEFREGHFPHKATDPSDPPLFESEAAYLDRHGLLTDAERAQLAVEGWPEPEAITVDADRTSGFGWM